MELAADLEKFNNEAVSEGWKAEVALDIPNEPVLQKGLELLSEHGDLLLAICLNNGYYHKENIYRMLKFSLAFSKGVQIFFTDGPAKYNYRAMGEPENEIVRKSRLHRNRLRNHCVNALERINASRTDRLSATFMDWESIYSDPAYQQAYKNLKSLYATSADFHNDIDSTTRKVLEHRMESSTNDLESRVPIAIEYVIEELAFILAYKDLNPSAKPIVDHGAKGFNYTYYEPWPVFQNLVNGKYDSKIREEIGFVIVKV